MFRSRLFKNLDWILLVATVLLIAIGLAVLYSTSFKATGVVSAVDTSHQILYVLLGSSLFLLATALDYHIFKSYALILYGLTLGSLVVVAVIGKSALGATRWINLGFFQFQPSEMAKLVMILVMAWYLSRYHDQMRRLKYLLVSLVFLVVPLALVLAQPDLGTALVLVAIWLGMVVSSRVRAVHLVMLVGLTAALVPLAWRFMKAYQRNRLLTFLDPARDPLGSGYNVVQSTIAVGSGRWFGQGLASGSQSQLNFLPSQHTDFIFAVLAEKLGFVGSVLVLALFGVMVWRGIVIALVARDRFGAYLAVGIVVMLLFHVFVNVGMNLGIMPVTGIPLPLISAGGTSMLVTLTALGILESIYLRHKSIEFK